VLKHALLTLALPPICFLYLTIFGLAITRRYRRGGLLLAGTGLAILIALALPAVGGSLIVALEQNLPLTPPPNAMPEAIVILGGDIMRVAEAPFARAGYLTLDRLRAGAALHRRTGLPILVTGGVVQLDRPAVGTMMADSLREDFQVPVAWVEAGSADTWENASHSAEILRKQGIRSVYVVTQAWHMRRAMIAFRAAGLIATASPTSFDSHVGPQFSDFLPYAPAWDWSYYALHEWIGCAWYALR
jgi:uncharacterized SAM-binding protein YcdF (DUF218 family)